MKQFKIKSECSGCSACCNICPTEAIIMVPDGLGFLFPYIDENKCINCNRCKDVCSFNDKYMFTFEHIEPKIFAVRHRDSKEIETSRSGAAFIALSEWILNKNGVVYGAAFNDSLVVIHKKAINKRELKELKGSKYVQSDITGIFLKIKEDLKSGKKVLFSGTPCQTAGLNSFLKNFDKRNLYLVDIICHGVPSPNIFKDYLAYLENKYDSKIKIFKFRDKNDIGWSKHVESIDFGNKKIYSREYANLFGENIMFRESCYNCYFTNLNRPSDITVGDYWGWEKTDKEFNRDDKGVSLILCNTLKGLNLFNDIKNRLYFKEVLKENCMQPNLEAPSEKNSKYDIFVEDYISYGYKYIRVKYIKYRKSEKFKDFLLRFKAYRKLSKLIRLMKEK